MSEELDQLQWQKADCANGACVEVADEFTTSSFCGSSACVEVARPIGVVRMRDTKADGAGPVLNFTPEQWADFVTAVKAGEFG